VDIPEIGLKSIVPLGLLLNELISNSLEHGFSDQKEGKIYIFVQEKEQFIILNYSDNGTWKSDPILNKPSFGLELIDLLTEQLEGNKQLETNESGSHYSFKFKNLDS
jgi:two-component sensor histidine kinase